MFYCTKRPELRLDPMVQRCIPYNCRDINLEEGNDKECDTCFTKDDVKEPYNTWLFKNNFRFEEIVGMDREDPFE